jgi:hypothetical protein
MKVSEDRYLRHLRPIQLAHRLIRLEARTHIIMDWTGLSEDRVRNLHRSYPDPTPAVRHRGPTPTRVANFLRATSLHSEASAAIALACLLGAIPVRPVPNARRQLPSVDVGERLCHAYELYRQIVPAAALTMDQFILLAITLAQGDDLELVYCVSCHGALLADPLSIAPRICFSCRNSEARGHSAAAEAVEETREEGTPAGAHPQKELFSEE